MNITDLIVELLQQGKNVEIPGIGTLRTEMQAAHHDPRTHTYYPARRVVAYSDIQSGSHDLIDVIAKKECVNEEIAEMMLKNYVSALDGKLQREGCHTFANIGTLTKNESGFGFCPDSNFGVEKNSIAERPIEHINTYVPKKSDPFAVFEKPAETPQPETEKPIDAVPAVEEAPAPIAEPEPVVAAAEQEAATPAEEHPQTEKTEVAPDSVECEPIQEEPKTAKVEAASEPSPETSEPLMHEPISNIEEPVPAETVQNSESQATDSADDTNELLQQLDAIPDAPKTIEKEEKKKKKGWLWLIVILLLLLIGAGAYYYFVYLPSQQPTTAMEQTKDSVAIQDTATPNALLGTDSLTLTETTDSNALANEDSVANTDVENIPVTASNTHKCDLFSNANIFTFNTDRIAYSQEEIDNLSVNVRNYLNDYVDSYLKAEGYATAKDVLMDSVERYANRRIGELLDNNKYCVQNFIPYNDYIHNFVEPYLKDAKASKARTTVQTEIMNVSYLAPTLNGIIDALQLTPEAVAKPKATATAPKQAEPNYGNVNFASQSKKGFDIIAGFFKNKSGAAKLTQSLKAQGCDAYIISTSNGHYVSMGSTSNRTQADAMYNHIKSWYSGDVVIKQW